MTTQMEQENVNAHHPRPGLHELRFEFLGGGPLRIKRINGGLSVGRTWIGFQRVPGYVPRRFERRSGGSRTPGPWSEYLIPFAGSIRVSHDRTVFGWDDPANGGPSVKVDV